MNIIRIFLVLITTALAFFSDAQGIQNSGNMYISGNMGILGTYNFTNTSTASYLNNGNVYIYADFTNNQASMVASTAGNAGGTIWFQGSATQALNGTQDFNFYKVQLNKTAATNLVNMSRSVTAQNILTLTKGIITTGNNLFTFGNTGTTPALNQPALYSDSYIATCDASGTPLPESSSIAFAGTEGFRINSVGSTDTYFPVGATYLASGSGLTPAPNRMMINNSVGTPNFTVVVNKGDIGGTPGPRVNRIWYVKSSTDTGQVNMKLYFTERVTTDWLLAQDEVEGGFNYIDMRLLQKDFSSNNNFISIASGGDIRSGLPFSNDTETYGQYTFGNSLDFLGRTIGLSEFNRFTIANKGNIILPVTITNLRAWQHDKAIDLGWTSVSEYNIDHYEIERSINGIKFNNIGSKTALNKGSLNTDYVFSDQHPQNGINYYRLKISDNNGAISFTNIVRVTVDGDNSSIIVYPNPATAKAFTVQMNNKPTGLFTLQLFDIKGAMVFHQNIKNEYGSISELIHLPQGFSRGLYSLRIINGTEIFNSKVLVE